VLEVRGLTKRYGQLAALEDFDLTVPAGRCVGLVGHNGSGKSTAVQCLTARMRPSAGTVVIDGYDGLDEAHGEEVRRRVSYVGDAPAFYPDLTVREHVELVAIAHGLGRDGPEAAEALLDEVELTGRADFRPHQLSAGMRQKAHLACAMVRPFEVLVLDEPAGHLDGAATAWLVRALAAARDRGAAVVVTSHDPGFLADLADEVVVLVDGRIGAQGAYLEALSSDAARRSGLEPVEGS
jgi:ABC-2 type transport system ATP-binding protein